MEDDIQRIESTLSNEQLQTINKTAKEIEQTIMEAVKEIKTDESGYSGSWNVVMAFYIMAKSETVGIDSLNLMRGLNLQVQELRSQLDFKEGITYE